MSPKLRIWVFHGRYAPNIVESLRTLPDTTLSWAKQYLSKYRSLDVFIADIDAIRQQLVGYLSAVSTTEIAVVRHYDWGKY